MKKFLLITFFSTIIALSFAIGGHDAHATGNLSASYADSGISGTASYATQNSVVAGFTNTQNNPIGGVLNSIGGRVGRTIENGINFLTSCAGYGVGAIMCSLVISVYHIPNLLFCIGYLFGAYLGVRGIMQLRTHVMNPQEVPFWEPIKTFAAGGAFLSIQTVIEAVVNSQFGAASVGGVGAVLVGNTLGGLGIPSAVINGVGAIFNGKISYIPPHTTTQIDINMLQGTNGLDGKLMAFVTNIYYPFQIMLQFFAMIIGIVLIMVGISRLMKSTQEGGRGPTGLGTFVTFLTGGALIASVRLMAAFSGSMFGKTDVAVVPTLLYANDLGLTAAEILHTRNVISSILAFMILIGWASFIRGIFMVRTAAEGGQASMMAAATHLLGGALAVNLGPALNAVQSTLGLKESGILFQ